jgi:hypothetical protein
LVNRLNIYPVFLAAAAAGINCHIARCDIATINDHKWERQFEQIDEFAKIFGFNTIRGDKISRAHVYTSIVVGSFNELSPTEFPFINANDIVWLGNRTLSDWRSFRKSGLIGAGLHSKHHTTLSARRNVNNAVWIHRPFRTSEPCALRCMDESEMRVVSRAYATALERHVPNSLLVVDTSLMTVVQQMNIVSSASIIGGLEGAGLTLQIWMPLGGALFMLTTNTPVAFQWTYGQYFRVISVILTGTEQMPRKPLFERAGKLFAYITLVPQEELHSRFNTTSQINAIDRIVSPYIGTISVLLSNATY